MGGNKEMNDEWYCVCGDVHDYETGKWQDISIHTSHSQRESHVQFNEVDVSYTQRRLLLIPMP